MNEIGPGVMPPEEAGRRAIYAFLATVMYGPPGERASAIAKEFAVPGSELGDAFQGFLDAFDDSSSQTNSSEYHDLFIGVGRGELMPFASYYLTGFLNEKPLADLREDLDALGFVRAPGVKEPEDHLAALCDVMGALIDGTWELDGSGETEFDIYNQENFFKAHLRPWAGRFFADLETAKAAGLYRSIGRIGKEFMRVEEEAFAMVARA